MRILIADSDVISSSKLKLVFSQYGECDIASSGKGAVDMFKKSHEAAVPYGFISLETDLEDILGVEVLQEIRKWEFQEKVEPQQQSHVLLIVTQADLAEAEALLEGKAKSLTSLLVKPYNRKKLESLLEEIGLKKLPPQKQEKAYTGSADAKAGARKGPDPGVVEAALKKINAFIENAEQFKGADGAKILDELVKSGGEEAERLVAQYMSSDKIPVETRLEILRAAGTILSPHFMIPLNKVMNTEDNIKVIQEAVLSIGKYENQRALNILNQALQKFKNPMLLNTIRAEVGRIKKNNPVLAILPRFLQSYKNLKNFRVTVDILKKIVTPEDIPLILNYLKSGNNVLEDGTFEILCFCGDDTNKTSIFNFFEDRIRKIPCLKEPECYDLYSLLSHLHHYLQKYPPLVDEQATELKELFPAIQDLRAKQIIISILCKSQRSEALEFIKSIYNQEKKLQEHIIEQLSGNQQAVDFLFEKYQEGKALKEQVVTSLLKSDQGLRYFITHFFTFELEQQESIIKNITFTDQDYLVEFINKIYASELYSLKFHLLKILKDNYLFAFKETLFAEDNQREFMFMGDDYINTIMELFPITTLKMFYHKIAYEDLSNNKIKKYLSKITAIGGAEPVLYLNDAKFINQLFNRIINVNNIELNAQFFSSFENIKILDLQSYRYMIDATNKFVEVRGEHINPKEKGPISRLKAKLREQLPDIRDIENLQKELKTVFVNKPIEVEQLDRTIEANQIAVALKIHHVAAFLADKFKDSGFIKDDTKQLFYMKYPMLGEFIKYLTQQNKITVQDDWSSTEGKIDLLSHFQDKLRVVIIFEEKRRTAFLKDQLLEMLPEFQILLDTDLEKTKEKIKESDFLVCDHISLKQLIDKKALNTSRIFLYLENRLDFAQFRSYNPRVFLKPISGHRVVRMLLQELYLQK